MAKNQFMFAQMGTTAIGSITDFMAGREQSKMDMAMQAYRNTMSDLSAAMTKNALTSNEIALQDASVRASVAIQSASLADKGVAAVTAAATGQRGNSTNAIMRGLERSRVRADGARRINTAGQMQQLGSERTNVELGKIYGRDVSQIVRPSAASALLGLGASMLDVYDSNMPEGDRTATRMVDGLEKWRS